MELQIWLKSDKNSGTLHRPYFVKKKGTTHKTSVSQQKQEGGAVSHTANALTVGYPPSVLVILEDGAVISLHVVQDH